MNQSTRLWAGKWGVRDIAYCGLIGALYAVLTIILAPLSYGVYQIRVAEALTVLPFIYAPAALGLFAGCFVANIFGGNGLIDIIFGSLLTLISGVATAMLSRLGSKGISAIALLAPMPPVVINALGVSLYLSKIMEVPYWSTVTLVGTGQLIACYALGLPFLIFLLLMKKTPLRADESQESKLN